MTETNLSSTQVAQLTGILTGGGYKRSATKEAAVKRFLSVASEKGVKAAASVLRRDYETAAELVRMALQPVPTPADAPAPVIAAKPRRFEVIAGLKGEPEAPAPKPAKEPKAPKVKAEKGERAPTKRDLILDMVCAEKGATEAEMCEALGWKKCLVTLRRAAAAGGVTLRAERAKGEKTRFFGARA